MQVKRIFISQRNPPCNPAEAMRRGGGWNSNGKSRNSSEPLMGWVGSTETEQQVQLDFPSMEAAVEYAKASEYRSEYHPAAEAIT